jgi:hypothetical protein
MHAPSPQRIAIQESAIPASAGSAEQTVVQKQNGVHGTSVVVVVVRVF